MSISQDQCVFCTIPEIKTTEYFKSIHGSLSHTLNIRGLPKEFTVLQDLVPLGEKGGHLLLIPNKHFISLATIDDQEALMTTIDTVIFSLQPHFPDNPFFMFEHGPGFIEGEPIACGGCHLDHAHGHVIILPEWAEVSCIQSKLESTLAANGWQHPTPQVLDSSRLFVDCVLAVQKYPYIYMAMIKPSGTKSSCVFVQREEHHFVPSQLLRKVVSDVIYNQPSPTYWHWKDIHMGFSSIERLEQIKRDAILFREITGF